MNRKEEYQKIIKEIRDSKNLKKIPDLQNLLNIAEKDLGKAKTLTDWSKIGQLTSEMFKLVSKEKAIKSWSKLDEIKITTKILDEIAQTKGRNNIELDGDMYEPSVILEWGLYRALASVFGKNAIFNGVANDEYTLPLSVAGGKKADLVVEFNDFIVAIEVTLTSSQRQYDTETEPVTRHLAELQKNNQNKKVYGIFVALDILLNVIDYFLIHLAFHKHPTSNKNILIVPMPLNVFNILYKNMVKSKKSESELKKFFEDIEQTTNNKKCSNCNMPDLTTQDFMKNCDDSFNELLKRL